MDRTDRTTKKSARIVSGRVNAVVNIVRCDGRVLPTATVLTGDAISYSVPFQTVNIAIRQHLCIGSVAELTVVGTDVRSFKQTHLGPDALPYIPPPQCPSCKCRLYWSGENMTCHNHNCCGRLADRIVSICKVFGVRDVEPMIVNMSVIVGSYKVKNFISYYLALRETGDLDATMIANGLAKMRRSPQKGLRPYGTILRIIVPNLSPKVLANLTEAAKGCSAPYRQLADTLLNVETLEHVGVRQKLAKVIVGEARAVHFDIVGLAELIDEVPVRSIPF